MLCSSQFGPYKAILEQSAMDAELDDVSVRDWQKAERWVHEGLTGCYQRPWYRVRPLSQIRRKQDLIRKQQGVDLSCLTTSNLEANFLRSSDS